MSMNGTTLNIIGGETRTQHSPEYIQATKCLNTEMINVVMKDVN